MVVIVVSLILNPLRATLEALKPIDPSIISIDKIVPFLSSYSSLEF